MVPGFTPIQDDLEHYERPGGLQQAMRAASARPGRGESRGGALLLFAGEAHLIIHISPISTLYLHYISLYLR